MLDPTRREAGLELRGESTDPRESSRLKKRDECITRIFQCMVAGFFVVLAVVGPCYGTDVLSSHVCKIILIAGGVAELVAAIAALFVRCVPSCTADQSFQDFHVQTAAQGQYKKLMENPM